MTDEQKQEGESQEAGSNAADVNDDTGNEKEDEEKENEVVLPPQPDFEADEEEMEPPSVAPASKEPLRDPRTGELLRDQDPGVPESKWVGEHKITDVDDTKEPAIAETDFGKE